MAEDQVFRVAFIAIVAAILGISTWFRWHARQVSGVIPRRAEGPRLILVKVIVAVPLYLAMLIYMIHPPWMA